MTANARPSLFRRHRATLLAILAGVVLAVILASVLVYCAERGILSFSAG
jgi:hypothetical protein